MGSQLSAAINATPAVGEFRLDDLLHALSHTAIGIGMIFLCLLIITQSQRSYWKVVVVVAFLLSLAMQVAMVVLNFVIVLSYRNMLILLLSSIVCTEVSLIAAVQAGKRNVRSNSISSTFAF